MWDWRTRMTDLVMQSIDTLSLLDFTPIPVDELKIRCHKMTENVEYFYWWRWSHGREALFDENLVTSFTDKQLLRFIAMMLREDLIFKDSFEQYCKNGALRAALVQLAIRDERKDLCG
jgi:hypothetical protein